jgi:hypothetical protein
MKIVFRKFIEHVSVRHLNVKDGMTRHIVQGAIDVAADAISNQDHARAIACLAQVFVEPHDAWDLLTTWPRADVSEDE